MTTAATREDAMFELENKMRENTYRMLQKIKQLLSGDLDNKAMELLMENEVTRIQFCKDQIEAKAAGQTYIEVIEWCSPKGVVLSRSFKHHPAVQK